MAPQVEYTRNTKDTAHSTVCHHLSEQSSCIKRAQSSMRWRYAVGWVIYSESVRCLLGSCLELQLLEKILDKIHRNIPDVLKGSKMAHHTNEHQIAIWLPESHFGTLFCQYTTFRRPTGKKDNIYMQAETKRVQIADQSLLTNYPNTTSLQASRHSL